VFLPLSTTNHTISGDGGGGNQHQTAADSPGKRSVAGNMSSLSSTTQDSSIISNEKQVKEIGQAGNSHILAFTSTGSTFQPTKPNLWQGATKENEVADGNKGNGVLTCSQPLIHNESPICVNSSNGAAIGSSGGSSAGRCKTEIETGKYSMHGKNEELIESDTKNGDKNEKAVSTSGNVGDVMNGATGNHVFPSSSSNTNNPTSITAVLERNEQQRLLNHQSSTTEISSVTALMNAMSSMGFNGN